MEQKTQGLTYFTVRDTARGCNRPIKIWMRGEDFCWIDDDETLYILSKGNLNRSKRKPNLIWTWILETGFKVTNEVSDLQSLQEKLADLDCDQKYLVNGVPRWVRLRITSILTDFVAFDVMHHAVQGPSSTIKMTKKKCPLKQKEERLQVFVAVSARDLVSAGSLDRVRYPDYHRPHN